MSPAARAAVGDVLESGFVGQGPVVERLEELLRQHLQHPFVNTVNSATSGLHLAVHMVKSAMSMQSDDEILTTPLTCTATTFAILANQVRIRWLDVDPRTCNIDLDDLARKIGPKTKALMIVHWGGYPCPLDRIDAVLNDCRARYGFKPPVIEDCAHAWGARYRNQPLGTHGNLSVFSFQAIKHFTTVDGGAILSPDEAWHRRAKLLRWYGLDRTTSADFRCEQDISEWGYKFHMNDVNAAVGIANLPHVDDVVRKHQENGAYYNRRLQGTPGVTLLETDPACESSYWVYTMHVDDRVGFVRKMTERGIEVSRVHNRNDVHTCVRQFQTELPQLDQMSETMICIPCGWWLTPEEREYIVDCIQEGW